MTVQEHSSEGRKLTFEQIRRILREENVPGVYRLLNEVRDANEGVFFLKIMSWKDAKFRDRLDLLLNGKVFIHLREEGGKPCAGICIVPDAQMNGQTVSHPGELPDVTFFVDPSEYAQFCQEARQIHAEYCQDGWNFGLIPSTWFAGMALIRFLREVVIPHPAFGHYMKLRRNLVRNTMWSQCDH
jgi:hypothetical protein